MEDDAERSREGQDRRGQDQCSNTDTGLEAGQTPEHTDRWDGSQGAKVTTLVFCPSQVPNCRVGNIVGLRGRLGRCTGPRFQDILKVDDRRISFLTEP